MAGQLTAYIYEARTRNGEIKKGVIEAESEDDAHHLCRDVRLEFIGLCEK